MTGVVCGEYVVGGRNATVTDTGITLVVVLEVPLRHLLPLFRAIVRLDSGIAVEYYGNGGIHDPPA